MILRHVWCMLVPLLHLRQSSVEATSVIEKLISAHYPSQYVVQRLRQGQLISIDGRLDEEAWAEVPWLDNFMDLAGPRHGSVRTDWQEASRDYARRLTGSPNPSRVKLRWDEDFLYVGAELLSKHVAASVEGHCDKLHSNVWKATPVLPYFDDDFEVFIDPSQSNYFYVEFEMNARNATYDTLWYLPQAGLGSVAPECALCCNTTWNAGKGLCDHDSEKEGGSWTMEMFVDTARPGDGMLSATTNTTRGWTLEIRFPILSSPLHGGLLNRPASQHLPSSSVESLHPVRGQRFWWATFANALHAGWWSKLTAADTKHPEFIKSLCEEVIREDERRYGFSQFLVDANNAAPTCYYEAASQNLGGHQYMHNPDQFGYLQFANSTAPICSNVCWLARFVLAQIYQAEVHYLMTAGQGSFTSKIGDLLSVATCDISNACNVSTLVDALSYVDISIYADDGKRTGECVRYAIPGMQNSSSTGGPCFTAFVTYTIRSKGDPTKTKNIEASINEARLMSQPEVGQRWDSPDADWLCLETVDVLPAGIYV
ncbi:CODM [Symbiodinium sp. CCMP2456]|nr:CODM [Symbiodinium sp. CCMP2456]